MLNIWLVVTGEPVPFQNDRPHRAGILARFLSEKNHNVTWWSSTTNHQNKSFLFNFDKTIKVSKNLKVILLHSPILYKKNVSLLRVLNHVIVAKRFRKISKTYKKPDIIFCCFPTIDLSYAALEYGEKNNVPVIIDVRDLWPDIFLDHIPRNFRPLAKQFLKVYFDKTKKIFQKCFAITAVSEGYLNWALKYSKRVKSYNDSVFPLGFEKQEIPQGTLPDGATYIKEMGIDTSKVIVWFVGTFGNTYDLKTIIQSARLFAESRRDIQFVFTGDGVRKNEWYTLSKGLNNIIFTGWANKNQLNYLLSIADIGLMAYAKNAPQGLPNKIFEYLSAGIPILSSLEGETKALLDEYGVGLSYKAGSVESFTEKLITLVDTPDLRKEMRKKGIALFNKKYSTSIIYSHLVRFIETVHENFSVTSAEKAKKLSLKTDAFVRK